MQYHACLVGQFADTNQPIMSALCIRRYLAEYVMVLCSVQVLPPDIREPLVNHPDRARLLEVSLRVVVLHLYRES